MMQDLFSPNLTDLGSGYLCCLALSNVVVDKVFFPGSARYNESSESYWSQQAASVEPACVFAPETAEDVSIAIQTLTAPDVGFTLYGTPAPACQFAVRSGGHTSFAGAASIEGGVTIDLRSLDSIELNEDSSVASVGVGARWKDVYSKLDPLQLAVVGGRAGDIGVGGFTTGGGISYFSPRFGWACDMVLNYQLVLADGSIIDAKDDPELLAALRGGSNNFGIVTQVDLQTFGQGLIWGGHTINPISTIDAAIDAFVSINSIDTYDPFASLITTFGVSQAMGMVAIANNMEYTKEESYPSVFKPLTDLPSYSSTLRMANLTDLAIEGISAQPAGSQQLYAGITVQSSTDMVRSIYNCFNKTVDTVKDLSGVVWSVVLEPLPADIYKRAPAGSSSLDLSNRTKPLIVTLLSATWEKEIDDDLIDRQAQMLLADIEREARRLGHDDPFIYLNYAAPWQNPIATYGDKSIRRLCDVRDRVDPGGVFTKNVPGGFKVTCHTG